MFHPQLQIGPYTLVRLLGRGGFGEVWLAEKPGALLTPRVALKLPLDPNPDLEAVKREARVWLQASGHPNVLPVQDAQIYEGQVVIVSEYAAGGSLASWLEQSGGKAPSVKEAIAMATGILAGLEYLHALTPEPIIHRDLKPDNVLLQGGLPRLTDFGISRVLKTTDQTQYASGTPHYMPPEAFAGRYSVQSDLWAVGVILYQMLSGRLPFPQSDLPSLYGAIVNSPPAPLPAAVPASLRNAVMKALDKAPARRPQSAAAMSALLHLTPQAPRRQQEFSRRALLLTGTSCGVAIASFAVWKVLSDRKSDPKPYSKRDDSQSVLRYTAPLTPTLTLAGHTDKVYSVAISADGKRIVTASADSTAKIWNAATGNELLTLLGHLGGVVAIAISEDGKYIVTGSADKTAKVWDAETTKELLTLRGHDTVGAVAISADDKRIVTGSIDNTAKVWDAETGKELLTLIGDTSYVTSVAIFQDGKRVVTGIGDNFPNRLGDHTAKIWDMETGKELLPLNGHTLAITSVAISKDGKRIVTGSFDNTAKVWDAETSQVLLTLEGHTDPVLAVAISADGKRIVTGSRDETAKVWNAETGQLLLTLTGHTGTVHAVAISADGNRIVTGNQDHTANVWTLPPGVKSVS